MSSFIKHIPCNKCGSKDNLGEYDDHFYCFGCGYYKRKDDLESLRERLQPKQDRSNEYSMLDTTPDIPLEGVRWLMRYGITVPEITLHNIQWCESQRLLVLINTVQYWQGRSFKPIGPKYLSHGLKPLTTYGKSDTIVVLVEDILSAIKVSRLGNASSIPLMGSSVSSDFEKQIVGMNKEIYIWLDRDKAKQAVRIKNRFKGLGCNAKVIITDKDPKEYDTQEISKWLKNK